MSADGPRGGSRRSRPGAGNSNDDLYNTNTQNVNGSHVDKASGRKVDLGTRSAGKNIHDSRNKHATQTVTINLHSPSSRPLSNKSQGKRQYRDSAGSENELSQEERWKDRNLDPLGQADGVANAPSHCSNDCKKRQRLDEKHIRDQTLLAEDLDSKLRKADAELNKMKDELNQMKDRFNDLGGQLDEAMKRLFEKDSEMQEQVKRIESYRRISLAAQDMQQAKDELYELERKDNEGKRRRQEQEDIIETLQRENRDLKITVYSAQRGKAQQEVSSLGSKMLRIQERKRKLIFDLTRSKEQIQDAKAQAKKERDRERAIIDEEKCQSDLFDAEKRLTKFDKILTTLETQLPPYEHPVSHAERSDSGYGGGTFSSVSAASPARSTSPVFPNSDSSHDTGSFGSFGRREYTIRGREDRKFNNYERPVMKSSYSSPAPTKKDLRPLPHVPMPPLMGDMSETPSSRERKQNFHSGR